MWVRLSGPDRPSKARLQLLSPRTKVVAQTLNRQILKLPSSVVICARSVLEPPGSQRPRCVPKTARRFNTSFEPQNRHLVPAAAWSELDSFRENGATIFLVARSRSGEEYSPRREPWVSGENMNKPRYGARGNAMTQIPEEPPSPLPSNSQTGKHHPPFPRGVWSPPRKKAG